MVRVSKTHHVKLSKHLSDLRQLARAIEQKEDRGPLVVEIIRLSPVVMPVLRNVSAVFCADVRVPSV